MQITLPAVDVNGNHRTQGPDVRFTFEHRGQAFVRVRLSWDVDKEPIVHPMPSGAGQPKVRSIAPGRYIVAVSVNASDLPGLPKTIDSDMFINGVLVLTVKGRIPANANVAREGAIFRLIVA